MKVIGSYRRVRTAGGAAPLGGRGPPKEALASTRACRQGAAGTG